MRGESEEERQSAPAPGPPIASQSLFTLPSFYECLGYSAYPRACTHAHSLFWIIVLICVNIAIFLDFSSFAEPGFSITGLLYLPAFQCETTSERLLLVSVGYNVFE